MFLLIRLQGSFLAFSTQSAAGSEIKGMGFIGVIVDVNAIVADTFAGCFS